MRDPGLVNMREILVEKENSAEPHASPGLLERPAFAQRERGLNQESWFAFVAIILVAIDLRPGIVSIGPVLPAIREEFGLSHASASLLTAIPDLLMGLLALPAPLLARRCGRNPIVLASLSLLLVSMWLRAFASTEVSLLIATAGVGAGIAVTGSLLAGFIKENFPKHAAIATGTYATSLSLGSTAAAAAAATGPLASILHGGWRAATAIWSSLGIVAIAIWAAITFKARNRSRELQSGAPIALPIKNKTAWMVAFFFAISNFLFYSIVAWTAPMFREFGLTATRAGLLLASFTFIFMCGNPIFGTLSRSHDRRGWILLSVLMTLGGLGSLALSPLSAPFVWLPIAAFGLGGTFTLAMTLPLDNASTVEEASTWNGFVLTIGYLIAATGPIAMGWLRDTSGTFQTPLWSLVGLAFIMLLITPFLRPHRPGRGISL